MTINDETTRTDRTARTYNHYDRRHVEEIFAGLNEQSPLLGGNNNTTTWTPQLYGAARRPMPESGRRRSFFRQISHQWVPSAVEHNVGSNPGEMAGRSLLPTKEEEEEENGEGDDKKDEENESNAGGGGGDDSDDGDDGDSAIHGRVEMYESPPNESNENGEKPSQRKRKEKEDGRGKLQKHTPQSVSKNRRRSFCRRLFLFLTEPDTSLGSAVFFFVLIFAICVSNIIMFCQTMDAFQYTPDDCIICGGNQTYTFDDDDTVVVEDHPCVCQPQPFDYLQHSHHFLMCFFAVEWSLRALSFAPSRPQRGILRRFGQWMGFLTSQQMIIDALATWPHFFTNLPRGFLSLRLLRLFRVFSLVRLGKYNSMFISLTNVLNRSMQYLKLMMLVLAFGAALFGSMMYWLEKGHWQYWEETGQYEFIRISVDGVNKEISPFDSIPSAFWWFMVTATTVGYGDYYPTSTAGKFVGTFAMLAGVLVLAFPVSVFSDLWSEELKKVKGFQDLYEDDDENEDQDKSNNNKNNIDDRDHHEGVMNGNGRDGIMREREIRDAILRRRLPRDLDDPTYIVMEKADLDRICASLHSIRENQKQIKDILRKYYNFDADARNNSSFI